MLESELSQSCASQLLQGLGVCRAQGTAPPWGESSHLGVRWEEHKGRGRQDGGHSAGPRRGLRKQSSLLLPGLLDEPLHLDWRVLGHRRASQRR